MQNNFLDHCAKNTYSQNNCATLKARITEPSLTPLDRELSAIHSRARSLNDRNLSLAELKSLPRELYIDVKNNKESSTRDISDFGDRFSSSDDAKRMLALVKEKTQKQQQINEYRFRVPDHARTPQLSARNIPEQASFPVFLDSEAAPSFSGQVSQKFVRNVLSNPTNQIDLQRYYSKNSWMIMDPKRSKRLTHKDFSSDLPDLNYLN